MDDAVAEASAAAGQTQRNAAHQHAGHGGPRRSSRRGSAGFIARIPDVVLDIVVDDALERHRRRPLRRRHPRRRATGEGHDRRAPDAGREDARRGVAGLPGAPRHAAVRPPICTAMPASTGVSRRWPGLSLGVREEGQAARDGRGRAVDHESVRTSASQPRCRDWAFSTPTTTTASTTRWPEGAWCRSSPTGRSRGQGSSCTTRTDATHRPHCAPSSTVCWIGTCPHPSAEPRPPPDRSPTSVKASMSAKADRRVFARAGFDYGSRLQASDDRTAARTAKACRINVATSPRRPPWYVPRGWVRVDRSPLSGRHEALKRYPRTAGSVACDEPGPAVGG